MRVTKYGKEDRPFGIKRKVNRPMSQLPKKQNFDSRIVLSTKKSIAIIIACYTISTLTVAALLRLVELVGGYDDYRNVQCSIFFALIMFIMCTISVGRVIRADRNSKKLIKKLPRTRSSVG